MEGQGEYDTGPEFEDDGGDESTAEDTRRGFDVDSRWAVGLVGATGTFLAVYAITYQFASALIAVGSFDGGIEPSRRALAGLVLLTSHGGRIHEGGEPVQTDVPFGIQTVLPAFVPVVVLTVAGYLLVRYLATADTMETVRAAGSAGGVFVLGYVALALGLARVTRWTRGTESDDQAAGTGVPEPETWTVPADSSLAITVAGTAVAFLALGGLLALLTRSGARTLDETRDDGRRGAPGDPETGDDTAAIDDERTDRTPEGDEPSVDRGSPSSPGDYPVSGRSAGPGRGYGDADGRGSDATDRSERRASDPYERYGSDDRDGGDRYGGDERDGGDGADRYGGDERTENDRRTDDERTENDGSSDDR